MLFLRLVELWIINFRSETAKLALPQKLAASLRQRIESGGATGGHGASRPLRGSTVKTKGS